MTWRDETCRACRTARRDTHDTSYVWCCVETWRAKWNLGL